VDAYAITLHPKNAVEQVPMTVGFALPTRHAVEHLLAALLATLAMVVHVNQALEHAVAKTVVVPEPLPIQPQDTVTCNLNLLVQAVDSIVLELLDANCVSIHVQAV